MPIINISGIPELVRSGNLKTLRRQLRDAVASVKGLGLTNDQTTVVFLTERCLPERTQLIAQVVGLFDKPERTKEIRQQLATAIRDVLKVFAVRYCSSSCELIEVLVHPSFDPEMGFVKETFQL